MGRGISNFANIYAIFMIISGFKPIHVIYMAYNKGRNMTLYGDSYGY